MQPITTTTEHTGKRLDMVLAEMLAISRAQSQKIIKRGEVLVNDKPTSPHYLLRVNDVITAQPTDALSKKPSAAKATIPELVIIAETDDYLVINKPAGVIVHGGAGITEPTLTDALEHAYPEIAKVGDDPLRPGIVHRLDKEASGLMVVAKTQAMFEALKAQFQARTVTKKYSALAHGTIVVDTDDINFPIARSAKGYKMAALPHNQVGRSALTTFQVTRRFINYTLVDVAIQTGRTHQIRVHFTAYGHPLVGDDLYGTKKTIAQNAKLGLGRIFLHAYELGFTDLHNTPQHFTIELPRELTEILTHLS